MSKIIVENIGKSFKDTVLENISFQVKEGEVVSLLGPSGCGKTTTLKIIAGLVKPDRGKIHVAEVDITNDSIEKRGIILVFQDYLLFPHLNVEENIGFGLRMRGIGKNERQSQVEEMLELVQLSGYNHKYPNQLSGGQRQRVALARALAVKPKVLLLDEPFSNLDRKLREEMRDFTFEIQKKLNITTILVTHDKEEALITSDRIGIMLDGQIKQFGTPEELYRRPNSRQVADFLSDNNYVQGTILDGKFRSELLEFDTCEKDNDIVTAMIRPEDINLSKDEAGGLKGKVISRRYAGDRIYYRILVNETELKVTAPESSGFNLDDMVSAHISYKGVILFPIDNSNSINN